MDTTREAYKAKMDAQLERWSARLAVLKAKAHGASAEARVELLKQADELEAFERSAKKHIAHVEASAAQSWHEVRGGIERTWNRLSGSVESIWAKISPESARTN